MNVWTLVAIIATAAFCFALAGRRQRRFQLRVLAYFHRSLEQRAAESDIYYVPVSGTLIAESQGWSDPLQLRFEDDPTHPRLVQIVLRKVETDDELAAALS